ADFALHDHRRISFFGITIANGIACTRTGMLPGVCGFVSIQQAGKMKSATLSQRQSSFALSNQRRRKRSADARRRARVELFCEPLEPRMLLATAAAGDQFVVAETLGFTSTPAAIAVQADGSFTAAWESFEEEASGSG